MRDCEVYMRIVYLIHSLHTAGGMEKVLTLKANWLCARPGFEVTVVTSHLRGRKPFFELDPRVKLVDAGVNDRIYGGKYRKRLQSVLDGLKPDVTVSLCGSDVFQLLKCSGTGARVAEYHFLHDKFYRKYPKFRAYAAFRTRRLERALGRYDAVVALSDYDLAYFKGRVARPERCFRIGNTLSEFPSSVSELSEKRFICVGRLSPEKNFADAVRVWKLVAERHPDWRLDIYGEGRERPALEALIGSLGLGGCVSLKGNCASVMAEYHNCSGLLVTSRYEGFGLMALEAAASGVPVVAYGCPGGLTEIVREGESGFVVPEGEVGAAAGRVCGLIEDEALRCALGRSAAALAQRYSPETIMTQWVELFEELVSR